MHPRAAHKRRALRNRRAHSENVSDASRWTDTTRGKELEARRRLRGACRLTPRAALLPGGPGRPGSGDGRRRAGHTGGRKERAAGKLRPTRDRPRVDSRRDRLGKRARSWSRLSRKLLETLPQPLEHTRPRPLPDGRPHGRGHDQPVRRDYGRHEARAAARLGGHATVPPPRAADRLRARQAPAPGAAAAPRRRAAYGSDLPAGEPAKRRAGHAEQAERPVARGASARADHHGVLARERSAVECQRRQGRASFGRALRRRSAVVADHTPSSPRRYAPILPGRAQPQPSRATHLAETPRTGATGPSAAPVEANDRLRQGVPGGRSS